MALDVANATQATPVVLVADEIAVSTDTMQVFCTTNRQYFLLASGSVTRT